jgi:diacylglycerol kinase family enzyme
VAPPDICVVYNPTAGRGRARGRLERLRRALGARADFRPTQGSGHAEALAAQAARQGFAVVAAAGGDGTVHEVACGLLGADRPDVALGVFPVGSANDYAHSLGLAADWWRQPMPWTTRAVDVGLARSAGRARYFVNSLGLGFNGAVTVESRRVRGLQGVPLYVTALLRALWYHYTHPVLTITLDGQTRQGPTLAFAVALGRREGNFVLAPHAQLDDGLFDYMHVGALRRRDLVRFLPGMITGRLPENHPLVRFGRCREVRVQGQSPLTIHVDGEFFALPGDDVRDVEITMLPGRLRVQGAWREMQTVGKPGERGL